MVLVCKDNLFNQLLQLWLTLRVAQTQRYFLELSYDGTRYHGWQSQPNAIGVQQLINEALSTVLRAEIETTGCGRTDTGVHARQFFAHFEAARAIRPIRLRIEPIGDDLHLLAGISGGGVDVAARVRAGDNASRQQVRQPGADA